MERKQDSHIEEIRSDTVRYFSLIDTELTCALRWINGDIGRHRPIGSVGSDTVERCSGRTSSRLRIQAASGVGSWEGICPSTAD